MPARVVAIDGYAVQTMVRLGLIDRIVGTGFPAPFTVDAPAYRERLAEVPVAGDRGPAMEQVAALDPDMVLTSYTDFDTDMNLATLGVPGIAGCMPSGKNAGTVTGLTLTYHYIRKIGMVFRVQDRAEALITELKERERAVAARIGNESKPRMLILVDNPVPVRSAEHTGGDHDAGPAGCPAPGRSDDGSYWIPRRTRKAMSRPAKRSTRCSAMSTPVEVTTSPASTNRASGRTSMLGSSPASFSSEPRPRRATSAAARSGPSHSGPARRRRRRP